MQELMRKSLTGERESLGTCADGKTNTSEKQRDGKTGKSCSCSPTSKRQGHKSDRLGLSEFSDLIYLLAIVLLSVYLYLYCLCIHPIIYVEFHKFQNNMNTKSIFQILNVYKL